MNCLNLILKYLSIPKILMSQFLFDFFILGTKLNTYETKDLFVWSMVSSTSLMKCSKDEICLSHGKEGHGYCKTCQKFL